MKTISFTLEIAPQAIQSGNRVAHVNGRTFVFSSKKKKAYVASISSQASKYKPNKPFEGAVTLHVGFILPRPQALKKGSDRTLHTKRPDLDNLIKGTVDGLSLAGFWKDDAQIAKCVSIKLYAGKGETAKIVVKIEGGAE